MRRPTADLMLLATVSLWALNFTVSKYILDHGFHPLAYSSIRYACAALLFAGITLAWEGSLRIARRDLPIIVFCTAVLFANQLSFVYALRFTTATTVALLFGTLPIFTALFARGSGVEHLPLRFWIAAGLVLRRGRARCARIGREAVREPEGRRARAGSAPRPGRPIPSRSGRSCAGTRRSG